MNTIRSFLSSSPEKHKIPENHLKNPENAPKNPEMLKFKILNENKITATVTIEFFNEKKRIQMRQTVSFNEFSARVEVPLPSDTQSVVIKVAKMQFKWRDHFDEEKTFAI